MILVGTDKQLWDWNLMWHKQVDTEVKNEVAYQKKKKKNECVKSWKSEIELFSFSLETAP